MKRSSFGVAFLILGAISAWALGEVLPWPNPLLIAVVIGALLNNTVGIPEWLKPGVETHNTWLAAGIVLMGASVRLGALLETGLVIFGLIVIVVVLAVVMVETLARNAFEVREQLGSLLAAGTGICGISAIAAVAGSIDADEETVAYAVGTVLLFDAMTLALYPTIGARLAIPDQVFGVWAGISMFSTGPVVAAGLAYSEVAGQWATITKLGRNALIGLIVLAYAAYYARKGIEADSSMTTLWEEFPTFVLGFLLLATAASVGLLSAGQVALFEKAYHWLFLIAFVGLGTELERSVFIKAGLRPITVVFITWFLVASATLPLVWLLLR